MSIENELIQLGESKNLIKNAIIEKGGVVNDSTPLKDYAQAIRDIQGGGGKVVIPFCINRNFHDERGTNGVNNYIDSNGDYHCHMNYINQYDETHVSISSNYLRDDNSEYHIVFTPKSFDAFQELIHKEETLAVEIGNDRFMYFYDFDTNTGYKSDNQLDLDSKYELIFKINNNDNSITYVLKNSDGDIIANQINHVRQRNDSYPCVIGMSSRGGGRLEGVIHLSECYAQDSNGRVFWKPFGNIDGNEDYPPSIGIRIIGSPSLENGIVTNPTMYNRVQTPFYMDTANDFEFTIKFKTLDGSIDQRVLVSDDFYFAIGINSNKLHTWIGSGQGWDIASDEVGSGTILDNTWYYLKFSKLGNNYKLESSTDKQNWNEEFNIVSDYRIPCNYYYFGVFMVNDTLNLQGSIDLNETNFKSKYPVNSWKAI